MTKIMAWEKWYDVDKEEGLVVDSTVLLDEDEDQEFSFNADSTKCDIDINSLISSVVISTPIGKYSIDDNLLPTNLFDCWIGHTNFDITKKEAEILNKVDGVEILKIMSRYRFFIGLGKLFDFQSVRNEIEQKLLTD